MIEINIKIPKRENVHEVIRRFYKFYNLLYITGKDIKYEMREDSGKFLAYVDVKETKENDYVI